MLFVMIENLMTNWICWF